MGLEFTFKEITSDQVKENNIIGVSIERKDVEKKDFKMIDMVIQAFEKSKKEGKAKMFLTFNGYEDVMDEIYEIKDIREYVSMLFKRCPHIFYFLSPFDNNNRIILSCLSDLTKVQIGDISKSYDEYIFEGKPINLIGMRPNVSTVLDCKIRSGIREYGKRINENPKAINELIEYLLNFDIMHPIAIESFKARMPYNDPATMYSDFNVGYWKAYIKEVGIDRIVNEDEFYDLLHETKSYILITSKEENSLCTPICTSDEKRTNIYYIRDLGQREICKECGSNEALVLLNDHDFINTDNKIFLPSKETYIAKKITPRDNNFILNLPVPVNPKTDKWYCIKCCKMHSFKYDDELGLSY